MTTHPSDSDAGRPRLEPHIAAFFAVLLPPVTSAIWLRLERDRPFVRFHALQSLLFGILVLGGYAALPLAAFALRGFEDRGAALLALGGMVFVSCWLVLWVIQMLAALTRREWEMPVLGAFARRLQRRAEQRAEIH